MTFNYCNDVDFFLLYHHVHGGETKSKHTKHIVKVKKILSENMDHVALLASWPRTAVASSGVELGDRVNAFLLRHSWAVKVFSYF